MIVEVSGGNSGVAEYLEKGLKQDRLLSRDELDNRVILDGDLELTDRVINSISDNGQERYLHITLSFREDDISQEVLQSVVADYKELLFAAYSDDEYNFYAEAHLPKVKAIKDSKTGEMITRKPHIHIVIPEINLLTGNKLLPTGYIDDKNVKNVTYLDAIQEHLNYKYNLESPKDFMRGGGHHSANVLSRIKGDFFGEKQSEFKAKLVGDIAQGKINTLSEFESHLAKFGEVKIRNQGKANQYFAIRLDDDKKFTNLKHPIFSEQAIVTKSLPKESQAIIETRLDEWKNRVSKEIKFVDFATPTFRQKYAQADASEKQQLLAEREQNYERKYRTTHNSGRVETEGRRARNNQPDALNVNRGKSRVATRQAVSLSGLQGGTMVHRTHQREQRTQSVLPENELNHLRNGNADHHSILRRYDPSRRRGVSRLGSSSGIVKQPLKATRSFSQIAKGAPMRTFQKNIFNKQPDSFEFKTREAVTPFERYLATQNKYSHKTVKFSQSNALLGLAKQTYEEVNKRAELAQFAEIRRNIEPNAFLSHLSRVYEIDPKQHKVSYAKDGSPRFNVGKQNLNASDFLTKHLNLEWQEAKSVLIYCYDHQANKAANQERLATERMRDNIKAFDSDVRLFEKQVRLTLHNMGVDNRNAFRAEKKRIYERAHLDLKRRDQELAIASFRSMQRKELIDNFAKESARYVQDARIFFQQSGYTIKSLEDFNMATLNSIEPAARAEERNAMRDEKPFEFAFNQQRNDLLQNQNAALVQHYAKQIYQSHVGEEVKDDYQGNLTFKNPDLQAALQKNNIGISKHEDGKIEYKSLTDGKLICTDDGEKMRINQKDLSAENIKFFLEVSIDRYGNELRINGSREFKEMIVESAAVNNLPVILKPAELQEQLMERRKELEMEKHVENFIESAQNAQQVQSMPEASIEAAESSKVEVAPIEQQQFADIEQPAPAQEKQATGEMEQPIQVKSSQIEVEPIEQQQSPAIQEKGSADGIEQRDEQQPVKEERYFDAMLKLAEEKSFEDMLKEVRKENLTREEATALQELSVAHNRQDFYDSKVAGYKEALEESKIDVEKQLNGTLDPHSFVEKCEKEPMYITTYNEALEMKGLSSGKSLDTLQRDPEFSKNYYESIKAVVQADRDYFQSVKQDIEKLDKGKIKIADIADKLLQDQRYNQTFEKAVNEFNQGKSHIYQFEFDSVMNIAKEEILKKEPIKVEFAYDKALTEQTGKPTYSVSLNGKPAQEAIKQNPKLSNVLDSVAKHKDLAAKGITANNLKSGVIQPKKLDNELKASRPENRTVNHLGDKVEKAKEIKKQSSMGL